jgi:hypothetical protein
MNEPPRDEAIYASPDRWKALRGDPGFVELLRLARVVNSLSLNYAPLMASLQDQSPKARRDRFAAFFYAAALLKEGLDTAQTLGKYFRGLPQYKAGFEAIFDDPDIKALRSGDLDKIRDQLVFHFDRDSIAAGLAHFPHGKALIATAPKGFKKQGEIYFDAADDALLAYLFGDAPSESEYLARVAHLMEQVTSLFKHFMRASHSLIPVALAQMGCHVEPFDRPQPPSDAAPMNRQRVALILPFAVAVMFLALSFGRPQQRGVWLGVAVVFLIVGLGRLRQRKPPPSTPSA